MSTTLDKNTSYSLARHAVHVIHADLLASTWAAPGRPENLPAPALPGAPALGSGPGGPGGGNCTAERGHGSAFRPLSLFSRISVSSLSSLSSLFLVSLARSVVFVVFLLLFFLCSGCPAPAERLTPGDPGPGGPGVCPISVCDFVWFSLSLSVTTCWQGFHALFSLLLSSFLRLVNSLSFALFSFAFSLSLSLSLFSDSLTLRVLSLSSFSSVAVAFSVSLSLSLSVAPQSSTNSAHFSWAKRLLAGLR